MGAKDFIVAIELGSSKVVGIAGRKNMDGSISVLAMAKEPSSAFIRKGMVYNIDKTAQCLSDIVGQLERKLKRKITQVYVGVDGQSIRSVRNNVALDLPQDTKVTQKMVDDMGDANLAMQYQDMEIQDVAVQEFRVDSQLQLDPVGIQAVHLEGNYLNILQRTSFFKNLDECFKTAGIAVADFLMAPLAEAKSVLTETERRSGCALVDMGADTTTVSVYTKNILRHLVVIPLGAANITKDIMSLQMEEADAEKMKLDYGSAYSDSAELEGEATYTIDADRHVSRRTFAEIVEGRVEEIIRNVWYHVPAEYKDDKLLAGVVLTGGGANMKNIGRAFKQHVNVDKVRIAKQVTQVVTASPDLLKKQDATMCMVLSLLAMGTDNCAGGDLDVHGNLFGQDEAGGTGASDGRVPRGANEKPEGVVRTPDEKAAAEAEAKRKREEEEAQRQADEEEKQRQEEIARKQNRPINKFIKGLKKFGRTLVDSEDE